MRIDRLELIRYGKFTDVAVELPAAPHDFHFIVGPNEAGKSTLRNAIAELLFGFPLRSGPMAFLHPQADLRLGAQLGDGGRRLVVQRIKAARSTLRGPDDAVLPDDVLAPFLGNADRAFFEQMFGLDHARLVEGGASILDASRDVSQVLFQSAAGIAGLGRVRDALAAEAERLWAPRAAATRAWYAAHARWEEAGRTLKASTVRSGRWAEAREHLDAIDQRAATATRERVALQTRRDALERVRRLAPRVQALREREAALADLGAVLELPADAAAILRSARDARARAAVVQQQRENDVARFRALCDEVAVDAAVLAEREAIAELVAFGQQVRNHAADLEHQRAELARHLDRARAAAAGLGWPEDEPALRARLPAPLQLREVQRLAAQAGQLQQARAHAGAALADRQANLAAIDTELQHTAAATVTPALRSAVTEAQAHRQAAASLARRAAEVEGARRARAAAAAALGPWQAAAIALARHAPLAADGLAAQVTERQRAAAALDAARERLATAAAEQDRAELAVRQFAAAQQVVTAEEVQAARAARDALWSAIRTGVTPLADGAGPFDTALALADARADGRLQSTAAAAELQSLRQQAERAALEVQAGSAAVQQRADVLADCDRRWDGQARDLGLAGLALVDAPAWFARREQAAVAAEVHAERAAAWQADVAATQAVAARLLAALGSIQPGQDAAGPGIVRGVDADADADADTDADAERPAAADVAAEAGGHAGVDTDADPGADGGAGVVPSVAADLAAPLAEAEAAIAAADAAAARRVVLAVQQAATRRAVQQLEAEVATAAAALARWQDDWQRAIAATGLAAFVATVADAEQAVLKVEAVRSSLEQAAATRRDRIDTMTADLEAFAAQATARVERLDAASLRGSAAATVARELQLRLERAEAARQRHAAAAESLATAGQQLAEARATLDAVDVQVAPLLAAAGVATLDEAAPLVERAERHRQLVTGIAELRAAVLDDADGLALDAVVAEVDGSVVEGLAAELAAMAGALDDLQARLTALAGERVAAEQSVRAIDGGNDAAAAEAGRQEALADLADTADRYLKVASASRLLAWAIDRYRDQQQGPMLARAGAVFAGLTLGRYARLQVDYEHEPPRLAARTADGRVVEVAGLSEGTRDQLYLALRLAALELHLGQARALPFVADDLFINFDDERAAAGLAALRALSTQVQVLFLSHHDHLLPAVRAAFGADVNVVRLQR